MDIFASVLACCAVSQMTVLLMNPKVPYRAFEGDSTNLLALSRTPLGMPDYGIPERIGRNHIHLEKARVSTPGLSKCCRSDVQSSNGLRTRR